MEELILYVELLGVAGLRVKYWKHSWIRAGMKIEVLSLDLLSPLLWK